MAKSPNQKLKLLYLYQILLQRTDEEHPITVPQLIGELDLRGIRAERKSVYDDLEALRQQIIRDAEEARSYFVRMGGMPGTSTEN